MAERIDFVVVGAGLAGLAAAAVLAREGARVAVFEGQPRAGGSAGTAAEDPSFAAGSHLLGGCGEGGWTRALLETAGLRDRLDLRPLDPVYRAVFPRHQFAAAADPDRLQQELSALWPAEAAGIRGFLSELRAVGADYLSLAAGPAASGPAARRQEQTLGAWMDDYVRDEELRAALSALWLFAGLPPARLSAVHYAMLWHSWHAQGAATIPGGIRALAEALAGVVRDQGGAVETGIAVRRIVRDRGRVTGVVLQDGREIASRAVISTVSPHATFEELLAASGQPPAGYPPLRGCVTSISTLQVHLRVTGVPAPPARTNILHTTYDLDDAYLDSQRDLPEYQGMVCTVYTPEETPRLPEGESLVTLYALAPYSRYDNWHVPFSARGGTEYRELPAYQELRERLADRLVARAEDLLPGLATGVRARRVETPLTLERLTASAGGAAFGWANIPQQAGALRPGPGTTFRGLFMAGQWTFPGGSLAAALVSGTLAAREALREAQAPPRN